ncbi:MAG: glycosyltransferase [Bacteroidetes bacterium]|nr:glycosyltransferase [Bacteroidota bacterium]
MKILFINHSASRTGAPLMLLYFLEWLKNNKSDLITCDVLTLEHEELIKEFSAVSRKHFIVKKQKSIFKIIYRQFIFNSFNKPKNDFRFSKKRLNSIMANNYDLIYANTVISIPMACYLKSKSTHQIKVIAHFHELQIVLKHYCPELKTYQKFLDLNIAASKIVSENLISNWGFDKSKIKVIYEHSIIKSGTKAKSNDFIVGASGLVNWRKGPDIFLLIAKYVCNRLPNENIKFQWVGSISDLNKSIYTEDIRKLNLDKKVEFVGIKKNPENYYSNFDIFLMTSREDPFPLVCIELGMMKKPIICFQGATGIQEVIGHVPNTVVPYMDIEKMGDVIIDLFYNKEQLVQQGSKMYEIFKEFNIENQSLKFFKTITALMK